MRAGQITGGHQKLVHDLASGEDKGPFEQLDPLLFGEITIFIQPGFEGTIFFLYLPDFLRINNRCVHFQAVTNDTRVAKQARNILFTILCDFLNIEPMIGFVEILSLPQDRDPGKSRLVDLEDETLEQQIVFLKRKAILRIVIGLIVCIFGVGATVITVGCHEVILLSLHPPQGSEIVEVVKGSDLSNSSSSFMLYLFPIADPT